MAQPLSATTSDALLGGRIVFVQPAEGYRAAIDPVLLAAAVPAREGEAVLDLGCGAGAASLCLAARVPRCHIHGLERDPALARLAAENAKANGLADRIAVHLGDIAHPPKALGARRFDHVMLNPPHLEPERADPGATARRHATVDTAGIEAWVDAALGFATPRGYVVLIHRADRIDALLACLAGRAGGIVVFPLWPKAGAAAKRVVVLARPGVKAPACLSPGLVLHEPDGRYTAEAEAVLRHGAALRLG